MISSDIDHVHIKVIGSIIRKSYKYIIGSIVCGMIIHQLPSEFVKVLQHPIVQFAILLNAIGESVQTSKEYMKQIATTVLVVTLLNSTVHFINLLYKKYSIKSELAIFMVTFMLLILQAPAIIQ